MRNLFFRENSIEKLNFLNFPVAKPVQNRAASWGWLKKETTYLGADKTKDTFMDFGKLESLEGVKWELPTDHLATAQVLQLAGGRAPLEVRLGGTAWGNKDWVGSWYPRGAHSGDYLAHYAGLFDTIELNTTYYRIPDRAVAAKWADSVPSHFRFCPKIPHMISHQKKLLKCESEVEEFAQVMTALGSKLGRSFLQLPPDFGPAHLPRLENFIHHFPKGVPLAIEFRHPAWFEPNPIAQRGFEVLQDSNIATVITDVAGRRDVLHMRLTASEVLVRFVGNSFHPTDQNRVENWADRLGTWKTLGLEKAYFFLHQPDGADVPPLGVMASDAFHAHLGVAIRRPKRLAGGGELDLFG